MTAFMQSPLSAQAQSQERKHISDDKNEQISFAVAKHTLLKSNRDLFNADSVLPGKLEKHFLDNVEIAALEFQTSQLFRLIKFKTV